MSKDDTAAIVDGLLKLSLTTSVLAAGLIAPNSLQVLGKLLDKQLKHFDERQRERELRRVISYMKTSKLLSGGYKHGLQITEQGRRRLAKSNLESLEIRQPRQWDGIWRIVFYDVPEDKKHARRALIAKLQELEFVSLQRSVLVHPLPCRDIIEKICSFYDIDEHVSYIETTHIDNQDVLISRFRKSLSAVSF